MTADELLHLHVPDKRVELVRGALVVSEPPGVLHGAVVAELSGRLWDFIQARKLGLVVAGDTGFWIGQDPDTVRGPDVAFIRRERVPDPLPLGFAAFAPDLAVEVLSPSDRPGAVLAKVGDWLSGGSRLVWVIDPERRVARIYRQDGTECMIGAEGELDGEDVVPGFRCSVAAVFSGR